MGMSKDAVLDALARFKVLQDEQNATKFVAKESGMTLVSTSDVNKLASIERGAQKNPDLSGYATTERIQAALAAVGSIFGGEYTPPKTPAPTPADDGNDDPDQGDETISDDEVHNLFGQ